MLPREEEIKKSDVSKSHRVIRECSNQTNAVHVWFRIVGVSELEEEMAMR